MSVSYAKNMSDPLTRVRQHIADSFFQAKLDAPALENISLKLAAIDPKKADLVMREYAKAKRVLATGASSVAPELADPLAATLWGAVLATLAVQTRAVHSLPVWQEIIDHPVIQQERQESAYELYRSFRKIGFNDFKVTLSPPSDGYPAIAYYCDLDNRVVNLDPLWMLLLGVEKARSGMMHEVGHALGTLGFPPKMQELRDEMEVIAKNPAATDEDRKRFAALDHEWKHRYYIADEAENSYANRFVINRGRSGAEDYGQSLNQIESVFGGVPAAAAKVSAAAKTKKPPTAQEKFVNLKRAVRHSLFKNNGFFPDTVAGWRSIGVEPDWIAEAGKKGKKGWPALKELTALTQKMEVLQPRPADMIPGAAHFKARNAEFWQQRGEVINEIYDRFAAPIVDELKQEAEKKQKQKQEQKKEEKKEQKKEQKPEQKKQPQQDAPQPGEGEPQQGEPQESGEGQQPQNGQKPQKPEKSKKGGKQEPQPATPQKGEGGEAGEQPAQEAPQQEMKLPPQTPQEMNKPLQDAPQPKGDTPDAPTVSDLVGDKQEKPEEAQQPGKNGEGPKEGFNEAQNKGQGGQASGKKGGDPSKDTPPPELKPVDLNEFDKLVAPHMAAVGSIERNLRQIMERQSITVKAPSPQRSLIPQDGNPARLDEAKLQRTLGGIAAGKMPRLSDFRNFKVDGRKTSAATEMDIEIIIDVSGSLSGVPFEKALQAASVLYAAARRVKGVNVSITAMGAPNPFPIARPGQDGDEISRRILQTRQTMGGGQDFLTPALGEMLARHAGDRDAPERKTGMTHVFVISDGYFGDGKFVPAAVAALRGMSRQLSADFLILEHADHPLPPIVVTVNGVEKEKSIGLRTLPVGGDIGNVLISMVEDRLRDIRPGDAVTRETKRGAFEKTLTDMKRRLTP